MPTSSKSLITIIVLITIGAFVCGGFVYLDGRGREAGGARVRDGGAVGEKSTATTTADTTTPDTDTDAGAGAIVNDDATTDTTRNTSTVENTSLYFTNNKGGGFMYYPGGSSTGGHVFHTFTADYEDKPNQGIPREDKWITEAEFTVADKRFVMELPKGTTLYTLGKAADADTWFFTLFPQDVSLLTAQRETLLTLYVFDATTGDLQRHDMSDIPVDPESYQYLLVRAISDDGRYVALLAAGCDGCAAWAWPTYLVDVQADVKRLIGYVGEFQWLKNGVFEYIELEYKTPEVCQFGGSGCYLMPKNPTITKGKL